MSTDLEMQVLDWVSYDIFKENFDDSDSDSEESEKKFKYKERTFVIKAYGLDSVGQSMCIHIEDFQPFFFVKVPESWNRDQLKLLMIELNKKVRYGSKLSFVGIEYIRKKEFFGFTNNKLFKFAKLTFKNYSTCVDYRYQLEKNVKIQGKLYRFKLYETNIAPMLRFLHIQNIQPSGWIKIPKGKYTTVNTTRCQIEGKTRWNNVIALERTDIGPIKIASFDIECTSGDGSFPVASNKSDRVIQIGTTFHKYGDSDCYLHHIITLGDCEKITKEETGGKKVIVESYQTEKEVIIAWAKLINRTDPDVITGYNIWQFDMKYIFDRVKNGCGGETFDFNETFLKLLSRNRNRSATYQEKLLSSAAMGDNFLKYFDIEGIVGIDLMKIVQKDHKLESYKLDFVAEWFLKMNKIDLPPRKIFENFRDGSPDKIKEIAVYCLKDCELVNRVIMKLNIISNNIGMSNVCIVPFSYLFLRGQGIKSFSLVAKFCRDEGFLIKVIKKDPDDKGGYEGAIVFPPKPGIYFEPVAVNDFASLYPRSMIAENISHDSIVWTKVFDIDGKLVKETGSKEYDELEEYNYNDIDYDNLEEFDPLRHKKEGEDFVYPVDSAGQKNKKKAKIGKTLCRFAEHKSGVKNVLPRILERLLKARADARKRIVYKTVVLDGGEKYSGLLKDDKTEIKCEQEGTVVLNPDEIVEVKDTYNSFEKNIWDSLQLAYKISCNSLYGILGASTSPLYYKELAACTTATGRKMVTIAKDETLKKFEGSKLIYGDSISGDSPLILRCPDGTIDIKTIETLAEEWEPYEEFKPFDTNRREKQQAKVNYQVWSNGQWADIRRVIRHKTVKQMYRVNTHCGCVDVTEDHSLLDKEGKKIKPGACIVGKTELLHSFPTFDNHKPMSFNELVGSMYRIDENASLDEMESFIYGVFFGDGSCGYYQCDSGSKYSWEINNTDVRILDKCLFYLRKIEKNMDFKVLDTLKSSGVYKLGPKGSIKHMVNKYRPIFYDKDKYKIVPKWVLNASNKIKEQFIAGYYTADGSKCTNEKTKCIRFDNKGKIGSQQLYYLMTALGYNCSINTRSDKDTIYRITCSSGKFRKNPNIVKKLIPLKMVDEKIFVYDLETSCGIFQAGVGCLTEKNTDSYFISYLTYIQSRHGKNLTEREKLFYTCKYSQEAADHVTSILKRPQELQFEKILYPFIIFSKKRYVANLYPAHNIDTYYLNSMGIVLKRRDNAPIVKEIYGKIIDTILNQRDIEAAKKYFVNSINDLLDGKADLKKLIITKSIRGGYANPTTIAHKVLADRMGERDPGNKPMPSDRIPYCYVDVSNLKCVKCGAGNLNRENCKCITCMKLYCGDHLKRHKEMCVKICRFCKILASQPGADVKRCNTCLGWYCPDDTHRHKRRVDKYKNEHFDKCKKPLTNKILQGDIIENPDFIRENDFKIDFRYYLDHQIEVPCLQIFGLTMKTPRDLIEDRIRDDNLKKSGNHAITQWFTRIPVASSCKIEELPNNVDEDVFENELDNNWDIVD